MAVPSTFQFQFQEVLSQQRYKQLAPVMTIAQWNLMYSGPSCGQVATGMSAVRTPSQSPEPQLFEQKYGLDSQEHRSRTCNFNQGASMPLHSQSRSVSNLQEPGLVRQLTATDSSATWTPSPEAGQKQVSSGVLPGNYLKPQGSNCTDGAGRFCAAFGGVREAAATNQAKPTAQCKEQQHMPTAPESHIHRSDDRRPEELEEDAEAHRTTEFPRAPVSNGSVGHPYTCAPGCKYARKKRGCKDGLSCDHCHLCVWKRCDHDKTVRRAAAVSKWQGQ